MSIPTTMKALVEQDDMASAKIISVPVPELQPNDVLVKVEYVGQNPTDWKHVDYVSLPGSWIGCDYVGTVVALGPELRDPTVKIGDRLAGTVHGGLFKDRGAFAEYLRVGSDLAFKVPAGLSLQEAPTWGIPWGTACHALIHSQKHPWPPAAKASGWYLIYGGSTGVGIFAIQLAKLLGYKVIVTASPHSFDLVKSYGADEVVSYHDVDAAIDEIKRLTGGGVSIGLDTISEGSSFEIASRSFNTSGGTLNIILPASPEHRAIRPDVELVFTLVYTLFSGDDFNFTPRQEKATIFPYTQAERDFYVELSTRTPEFFTKYGVRSPTIDVRDFNDILAGFAEMKAGKVSGKRLVYKVAQ